MIFIQDNVFNSDTKEKDDDITICQSPEILSFGKRERLSSRENLI